MLLTMMFLAPKIRRCMPTAIAVASPSALLKMASRTPSLDLARQRRQRNLVEAAGNHDAGQVPRLDLVRHRTGNCIQLQRTGRIVRLRSHPPRRRDRASITDRLNRDGRAAEKAREESPLRYRRGSAKIYGLIETALTIATITARPCKSEPWPMKKPTVAELLAGACAPSKHTSNNVHGHNRVPYNGAAMAG
jgi:hypothetical protein